MLAKPAAKAISDSGSAVVSVRIRAVCARCARAMASGPAPSSAVTSRAHLALLVAEPPGQALDAVPVDYPVRDQPHRPAHHVGPDVPLGRAGGGVRAAPLAGPEARLLGRRRAAVEPHVRPLRRDRRAGRPAVDAGRGHRDEEHPVEAGILADRGLVAPLVVERGHAACDRAVLAHAFHNASPRRPELAGIGHPPRWRRPPSRWQVGWPTSAMSCAHSDRRITIITTERTRRVPHGTFLRSHRNQPSPVHLQASVCHSL